MENSNFGYASPKIMAIEYERDRLMLNQEFNTFDNTNKSNQKELKDSESHKKRENKKIISLENR